MPHLANTLAICCLTLSMARSCSCDRDRTTPAPSGTSTAALNTRLAAALQMTNPSLKDDTLRKLATEAASAGEGKITLSAVGGIGNDSVRDAVARNCAHTLIKTKDRASALEVAKAIQNVSLRDDTLRLLAAE